MESIANNMFGNKYTTKTSQADAWLLYTSDAAEDSLRPDLGGCRTHINT